MQLARSIFSRVSAAGEPVELKLPFTLTRHEVKVMGTPDPRTSGFGPLFALQLLLACAAAALAIRRSPQPIAPPARCLFVLSAAVVAMTAIFPEAWWARFVPFLWIAPLFAALGAGVAAPHSRLARGLVLAIAALAAFNAGVSLAGGAARTAQSNYHLRAFYRALTHTPQPIGLGIIYYHRNFETTEAYRLAQWWVATRVLPGHYLDPPDEGCGQSGVTERIWYCPRQ
jgi:hypothetical protein